VIDCRDVPAQARWWAQVLGWTVVHEADGDATLAPAPVPAARDGSRPWEQITPRLVFISVPEGKTIKNRLHLDLAPHTSDDRDAEIARLLAMGATRVDVGQSADVT
jgi:hypothetical protein